MRSVSMFFGWHLANYVLLWVPKEWHLIVKWLGRVNVVGMLPCRCDVVMLLIYVIFALFQR